MILIFIGYSNDICGEGTSAGGLVQGVMANSMQYASLFSALVLTSPFLNILGVMEAIKDGGDDLLGAHEVDEWGDVTDSEKYPILSFIEDDKHLDEISTSTVKDYISSYCPLYNSGQKFHMTNVKELKLPSLFVSIGSQDLKVSADDAKCWVENMERKYMDARTSCCIQSPPPVIVLDVGNHGHGGAVSLTDQVSEMVRKVTFLDVVIQNKY